MDQTSESLKALGAHPETVVEIEIGTEHWMNGRIKLAVHGDGQVRVTQLSRGTTRDFDGRLPPERIAVLGQALASHGFPRFASPPGLRQPGDVPVRLALLKGTQQLHQSSVWYADRQADPNLDAVIRTFDEVVGEVTKGALPYGR